MMSGICTRLVRGATRIQASHGYVNSVTLIGNVGSVTRPDEADVESKRPVKISLALEKPTKKTEAGEKRPTQWFNVVIFRPNLTKLNIEKGFVSSFLLPFALDHPNLDFIV